MIDISQIDQETLLARGVYSTVRAAHEDEKKNLQKLCGELSATALQVLRRMTPDDNAPADATDLLAAGRNTLDALENSSKLVAGLAQQRAAAREQAWGRK